MVQHGLVLAWFQYGLIWLCIVLSICLNVVPFGLLDFSFFFTMVSRGLLQVLRGFSLVLGWLDIVLVWFQFGFAGFQYGCVWFLYGFSMVLILLQHGLLWCCMVVSICLNAVLFVVLVLVWIYFGFAWSQYKSSMVLIWFQLRFCRFCVALIWL